MTEDWACALRGPILVLGAGGFVGANLLNRMLEHRGDVYGVVRTLPAWRLESVDRKHLMEIDLTDLAATRDMVTNLRPATVFNCVAYAVPTPSRLDHALIYRTNSQALVQLVELLAGTGLSAFVHARRKFLRIRLEKCRAERRGYAMTQQPLRRLQGRCQRLRHLCRQKRGRLAGDQPRLYVYGPLEDASRLINVVAKGMAGTFPPFVDPDISRDFVYVDDVCDAFIAAAARLTPDLYGESFNIGSGQRTTIRDLADVSAKTFSISWVTAVWVYGRARTGI